MAICVTDLLIRRSKFIEISKQSKLVAVSWQGFESVTWITSIKYSLHELPKRYRTYHTWFWWWYHHRFETWNWKCIDDRCFYYSIYIIIKMFLLVIDKIGDFIFETRCHAYFSVFAGPIIKKACGFCQNRHHQCSSGGRCWQL